MLSVKNAFNKDSEMSSLDPEMQKAVNIMHSASLFAFCLFGSSHFLLHLILFLLLFTLCMIQMEMRPQQPVSPPS